MGKPGKRYGRFVRRARRRKACQQQRLYIRIAPVIVQASIAQKMQAFRTRRMYRGLRCNSQRNGMAGSAVLRGARGFQNRYPNPIEGSARWVTRPAPDTPWRFHVGEL